VNISCDYEIVFHDRQQSKILIWKCVRHFAIYWAPSLKIELPYPSVSRSILLLSSSEYVSYIVLFLYADIQNSVEQ